MNPRCVQLAKNIYDITAMRTSNNVMQQPWDAVNKSVFFPVRPFAWNLDQLIEACKDTINLKR